MWLVSKRVHKPYPNVEKIFPLKQRAVEELIDNLGTLPNLKRITIFGSSVTWACNPWSDVDVYIEGTSRDETGRIIPMNGEVYDMLYDDETQKDEPVYQDILDEGVVVFAR